MTSMVPSLKHPESAYRSRRAMLTFRVLCALVVAWAVNWVLGHPVSANLLEEVPQMGWIVPASGALVGLVALAKRQGWGIIVAIANGVWTMLLTLGIAWLVYFVVKVGDHILHGLISNFEHFLRVLGYEAEPLAEAWLDPRLLGLMLAATVVASLLTEALHWVLVRIRRMRGDEDEEDETDAKATTSTEAA